MFKMHYINWSSPAPWGRWPDSRSPGVCPSWPCGDFSEATLGAPKWGGWLNPKSNKVYSQIVSTTKNDFLILGSRGSNVWSFLLHKGGKKQQRHIYRDHPDPVSVSSITALSSGQ